MKKGLILLLGSFILFSSCKKEEEIAPNRLLDGEFTGKILIEIYDWTRQDVTKIQEHTYSMNLSIEGNKFEREDCGCIGEASINQAENTITFSTSQKDCATNWIIRSFKYAVDGDKINLLFHDELAEKLAEVRETQTQGTLTQVTISVDGKKAPVKLQ